MLRGWLSGKAASLNGSSQSLTADGEVASLEEAMTAALHIMNDDLEAAEKELKVGESSFHKLGLGLTGFLRAALGIEKDVIKDAQEVLWAADALASSEQKRFQKDENAFRSSIYEPGAEFALTSSQCLLMGSVLGLISESVTEALKGLYNLRKAYIALNAIIESETKYIELRSNSTQGLTGSATTSRPGSKAASLKDAEAIKKDKESQATGGGDQEIAEMQSQFAKAGLDDGSKKTSETDDNSALFAHPVDIYIHSGANLCFGVLLLILSMIPPAFGRLLSIIGFRGDRKQGLKRLWQTSQFDNINGAMAGLALLTWYNGTTSMCDIVPEIDPDLPEDAPENLVSYPKQRLELLLAKMRRNFPKSGLWRLEEARMLASQHQTEEAIDLLGQELTSPLVQVNALSMFERALDAIAVHRYELCADLFIDSIKLNNWSHALHFYMAGIAHVELYREARRSKDDETAEAERKKAVDYLNEVNPHVGKRKFMGRHLPVEVFCHRKLAKWEERAKSWDVPMIDAIGASPLEEMAYMLSVHMRMDEASLNKSLENLAWAEDESLSPNWKKCDVDEKGIVALMRAAAYRSLGRFDEARKILQDEIISKDKNLFKGGNRDDYVPPAAHYEMAAVLWQERSFKGKPEEWCTENLEKIKEAQEWIDKAKNWESYTLDARMGLKVASAIDTLTRWRSYYDIKTADA